ncbi:hypothetical protein CVT26_005117 [Gymnopilus dilepis]|uniref:Uncharacterized protein n=1 Tax=Gymnopilus dilepis TaxID=231916 RepID=A0A409WBW4_9AGAR|nr:hypothetical protein CVT26_005117 [Gymnopilus dilepis]
MESSRTRLIDNLASVCVFSLKQGIGLRQPDTKRAASTRNIVQYCDGGKRCFSRLKFAEPKTFGPRSGLVKYESTSTSLWAEEEVWTMAPKTLDFPHRFKDLDDFFFGHIIG